MKTSGLLRCCNCLFFFLPTIWKNTLFFSFSSCVRAAFTFCQICQPGVYCLLQMEGQEAGGMPWQATELHTGQLFMGLRICLGFPFNTHLPRCHKCPSAARESKSAFECCWKEWGWWWGMQLAALQVCHPILWEYKWTGMDGRLDEWMKKGSTCLFSPPRFKCICVMEADTLVCLFCMAIGTHFVLDWASHLLILVSTRMSHHVSQSNRCRCPKYSLGSATWACCWSWCPRCSKKWELHKLYVIEINT